VLTATGVVKGKWQNSTPSTDPCPLTGHKKLVTCDYVGDPIGAKFGANPSTGDTGEMGEIQASFYLFIYLLYLFFPSVL